MEGKGSCGREGCGEGKSVGDTPQSAAEILIILCRKAFIMTVICLMV